MRKDQGGGGQPAATAQRRTERVGQVTARARKVGKGPGEGKEALTKVRARSKAPGSKAPGAAAPAKGNGLAKAAAGKAPLGKAALGKASLGKAVRGKASARPRVAKPAGVRPPRFSRQDPDVRRQQIIEAALNCLARGGFGAFTVSEICAEAGISHGLINHYFSSKEELLVSAYRRVTDSLAQWTRVTLARSGRGAEDKLRAIVEASFSPEIFNERNLAIWLALWGQVRNHPELRVAHNELYEGYRAIVARQIEHIAAARKRSVEAAPLALALTALIDGLWLEWCLDPTVFSPEQACRTCYRLLEDRLGPLRSAAGEPVSRR